MLYNKHNLAVAKIASKSRTRPELAGLFITKDKVVATDSFKLVEMSVPKNLNIENYPKIDKRTPMRGMKPVIVDAEYLRKNIKLVDKAVNVETTCMAISHIDENKVEVLTIDKDLRGEPRWLPRIDGQYPDYEKVFPVGKPLAEVDFNAEFLNEVLDVLGKVNTLKTVKIKVYSDGLPIVLEAENTETKQVGRAMVMPLRK